MTDKNPDPSHIRLAKRVADQLNCSRSTAEQFVEGGCVSVDGQVVEAPGAARRNTSTATRWWRAARSNSLRSSARW